MKNYFLNKPVFLLAVLFFLTNNSFAAEAKKSVTPKEIIEQTYKDVKWDNLSIEIRQVKPVPQKEFIPMKLDNSETSGQVYYVSSNVEFNITDIVALDVFSRPLMAARGNLGIKMYLKRDAAARLKDYSIKHINDFIGIVINGKLRGVIKITDPIETNSLILGEFKVKEALDILSAFFKPLKPMWQYFRWP